MRVVIIALLCAVLAGCSNDTSVYTGPDVTRIVVFKEKRKMYLLHKDTVLTSYDIDLGFAPVGHKEIEGDGKTPEGNYLIDRRNPNSKFYLSIGLNYPNTKDVAAAKALGKSAGGDIFIHGESDRKDTRGTDWTWGCISVSDKEMLEIYRMVQLDTLISIVP
jgi:murein L,D-transpeptidase YafK